MGREAQKVPQQFSADAEQPGCSVKAQSSTTGGNNKIGSGKVKGREIFFITRHPSFFSRRDKVSFIQNGKLLDKRADDVNLLLCADNRKTVQRRRNI